MARRNNSILDDLVMLPWWVSGILAIIVLFSFTVWIPSLSSLAPLAVGLLCLTAVLSALNSWRKRELLERQESIETIRALSWQKFEALVGEAYRRRGYSVAETGGGGADGGIDLVLRMGGEKLLVQCKQWRLYKVGVKVIRELYGVLIAEGATGGIIITSGTFTGEAKSFATGKPLELIDGSKLLKMIAEVQKTPMPVTPASHLSDDIICPLCGSKMVLRTAKRGSRAGENFWGCSAFPKSKCRGTRPCVKEASASQN